MYRSNSHGGQGKRRRSGWTKKLLIALVVIGLLQFVPMLLMFGATLLSMNNYLDTGYYKYNDTVYYKDYDTWYVTDDNNNWTVTTQGDITKDNYIGNIYSVTIPGIDFHTSGYYSPDSSNYYYYGNEYYVYYRGTYSWYKWNSNTWAKQYTSSVPFKLRCYYTDYQTADWDRGTYPIGTMDFRSTKEYEPESGYYTIGGDTYFNYYGDWYQYNGSDYNKTQMPSNAYQYEGDSVDTPYGDIEDFYDSDIYTMTSITIIMTTLIGMTTGIVVMMIMTIVVGILMILIGILTGNMEGI